MLIKFTVASLYILQSSAYHSYCKELPASDKLLPFKIWCQAKNEQHLQFYYWSTVMELELLMMEFIRSLLEGNFNLYVDSLNQLAHGILHWIMFTMHTGFQCTLTREWEPGGKGGTGPLHFCRGGLAPAEIVRF